MLLSEASFRAGIPARRAEAATDTPTDTTPKPPADRPETGPDYADVARALAASELSASPSEAHGMLCGLLCGGAPDPRGAWLGQLLPGAAAEADTPGPQTPAAERGSEHPAPGADLLAREVRDTLLGLAERTAAEVAGPGIRLTLLLPDENRPLLERATALYDWVRGFLYALGLLGISERDLSEESREVLRDFVEITRMDLSDLAEDEANEDALTELTELVWVAAMLIREERHDPRAAPDPACEGPDEDEEAGPAAGIERTHRRRHH